MNHHQRFLPALGVLASIFLCACQPSSEVATSSLASKPKVAASVEPTEREKLLQFCGNRHIEHLAGKYETDLALKQANDDKCWAAYERG